MRRYLPALLLLLLLPATAAMAGPEKEFSKYGFKWSLPDDWVFGATSPDDEKNGFVAKAEYTMATIEIFLYTSPTDGLDVAGRVQDIKDEAGEGLGQVSKSKVIDTTLSGVPGKAVLKNIKADGGNAGHFRTYVITSGGRFYQMIMRTWHGANESEADTINAARKGFRLLKGAKGEDKDETLMELGSADEGGSDGDAGTNGGGSDDGWPAGGAKKEGRKVSLPSHNVEWTLPEGPFRWHSAPTAEKEEKGLFVIAVGAIEREAKQEFEKDRPASRIQLDMIILPANPSAPPVDEWIRAGAKVGREGKPIYEAWGLFDGNEVDTGRSRTFENKKIGNVRGGILKVEGKFKGGRRALVVFLTTLRGQQYRIRAIVDGADDAYKHAIPEIGKAVKGIKFLETEQPLRGPLLAVISAYNWTRGEKKDQEKTYKGPGFSFKKPKGMAYIKVSDSMNRDLRWAGEGRSKDGKLYFYFEVRTFKLNVRGRENPKPEKFVNKRAEAWNAGAGEKADVGNTKGVIGKKGNFGKAKGTKYSFEGHLAGVPFLEEGYVVKHKNNLLWLTFQYGGEGAQKNKEIKKLAKAVKKGFKLSK